MQLLAMDRLDIVVLREEECAEGQFRDRGERDDSEEALVQNGGHVGI